VPENIETCVERRYFSTVHRLTLTCDDDVLANRLLARPQWRDSAHEPFIQNQISFNRWFREIGPTLNPPITPLDTTHSTLDETVTQVANWITQAIS
jgi:hypothetical protein